MGDVPDLNTTIATDQLYKETGDAEDDTGIIVGVVVTVMLVGVGVVVLVWFLLRHSRKVSVFLRRVESSTVTMKKSRKISVKKPRKIKYNKYFQKTTNNYRKTKKTIKKKTTTRNY